MGFIDYHGTKESRYTEVLDYARAQQQEDRKRKQNIKIKKWLDELTGNGNMSDMNIHELLKTVIVKYNDLLKLEGLLDWDASEMHGISTDKLWRDYTLDLIRRHIDSFHMDVHRRNKHFDTFVIKIFKIGNLEEAEEFFQNISDIPKYKKYFTECFDPTWKDRQFFKFLNKVCGKDKNRRDTYGKFLVTYRMLGLSMALYLNQAVQPLDDGWILQETAEWNALTDLEEKLHNGTLNGLDFRIIKNPIDNATVESLQNDASQTRDETADSHLSTVRQSKLRKDEFKSYLEKADIPSYINAIRLLLECDLSEDIKNNYEQLISRMTVLQDSVNKFDEIYHADLDQFKEYFAPETLRLTATYLDYLAAGPSEKILCEISENVLIATRKLLQAVNEKIDEIYKFVTIDANAEAKALEAIMSQCGYVDSEYKIKSTEEISYEKHE